jgi:hypothetical protein
MTRASIVCLVVGACAASAAELHKDADRDNPRAHDAALAKLTRGRDLKAIELPVIGTTPDVTYTPLGSDGLVQVPSSASAAPALGFAEASCESGDSCGCDVGAEYHYWTEGAKIVIARMVPDIETHVVRRAGTCAEGCGAPQPPPPTTIRSLGSIDPKDVELVQLHYHYDRIVETCEHPMPVP